MNTSMLKELLKIAENAALKAGKYITEFPRDEVEVDSKEGKESLAGQVVTQVDRDAENIIVEALAPSMQQYDLGLLTEETEDDGSRLTKSHFWCIDPIDGTLSFIRNTQGYTVSIGLIDSNGDSVVGVIYDPVEKVLFKAAQGIGVFKNDQPFEIGSSEGLTFVCDSGFKDYPGFDKMLDVLRNDFGSLNLIAQGGAARNAMWVLEHGCACYFKFPKKTEGGGSFWDYAGSKAIFNEIGARATGYDGSPLLFNSQDSVYLNKTGVFYTSSDKLRTRIVELVDDFNLGV